MKTSSSITVVWLVNAIELHDGFPAPMLTPATDFGVAR